MLGWHITVSRQKEDRSTPAMAGGGTNDRVAVWQATLGGLEWIDELVKTGDAQFLGGCGYPTQYTAKFSALKDKLHAPPEARSVWTCSEGDILSSGWEGKTTVSEDQLKMCDAEEWVHINVWDES